MTDNTEMEVKKSYTKPQIAEIGNMSRFVQAAGYTPPTDGQVTGVPGMMMILIQPTPPMS
jgi:hypothetical protein